MILRQSPISGAVVIDLQAHADERGHFARTFDAKVFAAAGLANHVEQCSTSFNRLAGTLRGMHHQLSPHAESKLVRCTRGSVYDVIVDLRLASPSHRTWFGTTLDAAGGSSLFVPAGCAHGFLTLEDDSEVLYQIDAAYVPGASDGVRWDDPAFGIEWPSEPVVISERDRSWPSFVAQT